MNKRRLLDRYAHQPKYSFALEMNALLRLIVERTLEATNIKVQTQFDRLRESTA